MIINNYNKEHHVTVIDYLLISSVDNSYDKYFVNNQDMLYIKLISMLNEKQNTTFAQSIPRYNLVPFENNRDQVLYYHQMDKSMLQKTTLTNYQ